MIFSVCIPTSEVPLMRPLRHRLPYFNAEVVKVEILLQQCRAALEFGCVWTVPYV